VTLSRLTGADVVRFVQRQAQRLHVKRAKLMTTSLRSFLRYARYRGDIVPDLASVVPTVANWSMTAIPRAIPADAIRQLLASINQRTQWVAVTTLFCYCSLAGTESERSGKPRTR